MDTANWFALVVGALALAAIVVLSAAAVSVPTLSRTRLISMDSDGVSGAGQLLRVVERRLRTLDAVHLGLALSMVTVGSTAAVIGFHHHGRAGGFLGTLIAMVAVVAAGSLGARLARRAPERVALRLAPWINLLGRVVPVSRRRREERPDGSSRAAEDDETETRLLHSISEFSDTFVSEVMVPRLDVEGIALDGDIDHALRDATRAGYSRLPCYEQDLDHVVGLVYLKDLIQAAQAGRGARDVREVVRPALFVPEQKRVAELLKEMQTRRAHMAIVVDEHGGTAGLITLEDVLEEIVGEIDDEYDETEQLIERLGGGVARIAGRASIDEINEEFGLDLPDGEWDTLGGLVLHLVGRMPEVGETVTYEGIRFQVERMQGRRIHTVRMTKPETTASVEDRAKVNES